LWLRALPAAVKTDIVKVMEGLVKYVVAVVEARLDVAAGPEWKTQDLSDLLQRIWKEFVCEKVMMRGILQVPTSFLFLALTLAFALAFSRARSHSPLSDFLLSKIFSVAFCACVCAVRCQQYHRRGQTRQSSSDNMRPSIMNLRLLTGVSANMSTRSRTSSSLKLS
jgi:hypothetical protein